METFVLDNDIKVLYLTATSFPAGIMKAHEDLHKVFPNDGERKYFGISRPKNGAIAYKAAVEEKKGDEKLNLDKFTIQKGRYICTTIKDYDQKLPEIEKTFKILTSQRGIDPDGYCIEWYLEKDVRCMVRMKD